jgi:16S rRNA processing protein RimM
MPYQPTDYVIIGKISGVHGLRGWVKVFSYTRPLSNILDYSPWQIQQRQAWQTVKLISGKLHGKGIIAQIEGCDSPESAALLRGCDIAVQRQQLPATDLNEYYWLDLIGLTVINQQGINLGQVASLLETGSNDVLIVKNAEQERLIPFLIPEFVQQVDLPQKQILVDWDAEF